MANKKNADDVSKERQRQQIVDATRVFLESGGEITMIRTGKSGVDFMKPGQKQIKLGTSK